MEVNPDKATKQRVLTGWRLDGLLKRLSHHPKVLQEYHAVMQEQLQQGISEKVDKTQQTTQLELYTTSLTMQSLASTSKPQN